jgi:hypothetical protein
VLAPDVTWPIWNFQHDGVCRGHRLDGRNGINGLREKLDLQQPISPNRHRSEGRADNCSPPNVRSNLEVEVQLTTVGAAVMSKSSDAPAMRGHPKEAPDGLTIQPPTKRPALLTMGIIVWRRDRGTCLVGCYSE